MVLKAYPIPLLLVRVCFCPQLLNAEEQSYSIANLIDAHLLEDVLVHLQQVLAIDVVFSEQLLIFAAFDAPQVFTDLVLGPVLNSIRTIDVGEFRFGRARKGLARGGDGNGSSGVRHVGGRVPHESRSTRQRGRIGRVRSEHRHFSDRVKEKGTLWPSRHRRVRGNFLFHCAPDDFDHRLVSGAGLNKAEGGLSVDDEVGSRWFKIANRPCDKWLDLAPG